MNAIWRSINKPIVIKCILRRGAGTLLQKPICTSIYNHCTLNTPALKLKDYPATYTGFRLKSKKVQHDSDDEDEVLDEDSSLSRDSKVMKFSTTSMRTDSILKSALGVARNKIEQVFYESKIRVNGKKILKKSYSVREGDEIDVIKAVSPKNPDHLYISRVELLSVTAKDDSIAVTARRFKTLLVENYEKDPYKATSNDNEN